jgi:hypothetical protein
MISYWETTMRKTAIKERAPQTVPRSVEEFFRRTNPIFLATLRGIVATRESFLRGLGREGIDTVYRELLQKYQAAYDEWVQERGLQLSG